MSGSELPCTSWLSNTAGSPYSNRRNSHRRNPPRRSPPSGWPNRRSGRNPAHPAASSVNWAGSSSPPSPEHSDRASACARSRAGWRIDQRRHCGVCSLGGIWGTCPGSTWAGPVSCSQGNCQPGLILQLGKGRGKLSHLSSSYRVGLAPPREPKQQAPVAKETDLVVSLHDMLVLHCNRGYTGIWKSPLAKTMVEGMV